VLAEILKVGPASLKVQKARDKLLQRHGSELFILEQAPPEEIQKHHSALLAEGLARLRRSQVQRQAGYDGEYGRIRLFNDDELPKKSG
jgi:DNA helicase II / ATP-dependent DNA helicase PcrA